MKTLTDWLVADPRREAEVSFTALLEDRVWSTFVTLEIHTENESRVVETAALDYGLEALAREAIAKTRPLSFPPKPLPVAILGRKSEPGGKRIRGRNGPTKAENFAALAAADPNEEGEG